MIQVCQNPFAKQILMDFGIVTMRGLNSYILADILSAHRQEVVDMILTEYNEELHLQREREIALEEGESRGEMLKLISQVRKKMAKSMNSDEIAEMLEEDLPVIERIYRVIEEHSEWEDTQVYEECCKNKN